MTIWMMTNKIRPFVSIDAPLVLSEQSESKDRDERPVTGTLSELKRVEGPQNEEINITKRGQWNPPLKVY